ncbi:hypothetical protein BDW02DRAFT_145207 [Decorospora gaudefroyi]|uniref:Uncharacterized protein n=1 Tax=Decorospora gaudefroyi TaxID=184978 RepID=A0A6A5JZ81_9PLEO|nr:hypothetical protein BDW02DRAFT_145207 [Decorospora gaudefroyi]
MGGDGGRGVESLQVLLSSLRVVAQKLQSALVPIRPWADPSQQKGPRCAGRCGAVKALEGLGASTARKVLLRAMLPVVSPETASHPRLSLRLQPRSPRALPVRARRAMRVVSSEGCNEPRLPLDQLVTLTVEDTSGRMLLLLPVAPYSRQKEFESWLHRKRRCSVR